MSRIFVVGAGIAGLSAAFRLQEHGHTVTVLEAGEQVGGKTQGSHGNGYAINRGAQLIPTRYAATVRLAQAAGVAGALEPFVPTLGIVRDGGIHELRGAGPGMVVDALRLKSLSAGSKAKLANALSDAVRMRRAYDYRARAERAKWDTETVAEYCARRLNAEIRDYVINPLMRGLFLVDADVMPIFDFFFCAANLLGSKLYRYRHGLDSIARAVASSLDVRLGTPVQRVARTATGVEVDGEAADGCVLALPGPVVPQVYADLPERAAEILAHEMQVTTVLGLHVGTRRPLRSGGNVALTFPRVEQEGLATLTFQDTYNTGAAPPGKGLVSAWFDNDWSTPRRDALEEQLLAEMLPIVQRHLPELESVTEFTRIDRWYPCTPLNVPGLHRLGAELDALTAADPTVQLAGDFFGLATVNGAVVAGEVAAERLAAARGSGHR